MIKFFKSEVQAESYVHGLYNHIPTNFYFEDNACFMGADELISSKDGNAYWYPYKAIIYNLYSPNEPYFNYWSSQPARYGFDLYSAIRKCYIFLNRIDDVPGMASKVKEQRIAEVKFLIAYFHYVLMEYYGPIVIVDKETPIDSSKEELFTARSTYDECVSFVTDLLDEVATVLPVKQIRLQDYGRTTAVAAKALKARILLTAASPLFNGNSEYYSDFKNHDGTLLISQNYDAAKWKKAKDAAEEAIKIAENDGGAGLYYASGYFDSDFEKAQSNYRLAFVDKWNKETLWGLTNDYGWNGNARYLTPRVDGSNTNQGSIGNIAPTFTTVEMYYTKNGLPLDLDPETKDLDLYAYSDADKTAVLNLNREPRFYASIAYDGGTYEFGNKTYEIHAFAGQEQGYVRGSEFRSESGYYAKKWVHPYNSSYDKISRTYKAYRYPFPILRLAELYLSYAEADLEEDGVLSAKGVNYLDKIRERAGLPTLAVSCSKVGGLPTGDAMRTLIHRERSIEMLMESRRYFDLRRWKTAHIELNKPQKAWNIAGTNSTDFYKIVSLNESGTRSFERKNYLHPIHIEDININPNLVQNPYW